MTAVDVEHSVGLIQQFIERTSRLYSLPAVAAELLRLTAEDQVTPRQLQQCLERDPALAARVLRAVNSSLFGLGRPIADLGQALTVLGIRPLRMLVLGFSLPRELFTGLQAEVLSAYWRGSLQKAIAARELAEQCWHLPGDEPLLAGLVQDLGMLVLIQELGEPYLTLVRRTETWGGSLLDAELEVLGFDHLVLSSRLLAHWGLPAWLCEAVAVGPDEARIAALDPPRRPLAQILHLAHLLHRLLQQPHGDSLQQLYRLGPAYGGLQPEQLGPLVARLQGQVEELAEVLRLDLGDGQDYVSLLLAAQEHLAREALAAAPQMRQPADPQWVELAQRLRQELAAVSQRAPGARPAVEPLPAPGHARGWPIAGVPCRPNGPSEGSAVVDPPAGQVQASGLPAAVTAAIVRCRQARVPLSLILLEVDQFAERLVELGPARLTALLQALVEALPEWSGLPGPVWRASDSRLALVGEDTSRSEAVQAVRLILARAKAWAAAHFPLSTPLTLSGGVAAVELITRNFPAGQLLQAAERCLVGASLSGGDTVKSIAL